MTANVVRLRPDAEDTAARTLDAFHRHLDRCDLVEHSRRAYRRQADAYTAWLAANPGRHPDAFADDVGATAAVKAWRRHLLDSRRSPATINQSLAAVTLLYKTGSHLRPTADRPKVPRPGAPDALDRNQGNALQRAADRRGPRDGAIIATLLGSGARVEECARLTLADIPWTARKATIRLVGKGDEERRNPVSPAMRERVELWLPARASLFKEDEPDHGRLWLGQRGPMGIEGITKAVAACGRAAGIPDLRPHRLRHTYATRLREDGVDIAVIQRLMGHASIETTQRYFRASDEEIAEAVARVFAE